MMEMETERKSILIVEGNVTVDTFVDKGFAMKF